MKNSEQPKIKTNADRDLATEIVTCLKGFAGETFVGPTVRPYVLFHRGDRTVELVGDSAAAYHRALSLLQDEQCFSLASRYSDKYIDNQLKMLLLDIYDRYGTTDRIRDIKQIIHEWWQGLVSAPIRNYTFYFVVGYINLESDWSIGDCLLSRLTPERAQDITTRVMALVEQNRHESEETKEAVKKVLLDSYLNFLNPSDIQGLVLCTVTQRGYDMAYARASATAIVEEIMELLRFLALAATDPSFAASVSFWDGHNTHPVIRCVAIEDDIRWGVPMAPAPMLWVDLTKVERSVLQLFSQLYSKPLSHRSKVEQSITRAIHWLSKAASDTSTLNALLFTWLAFETLFAGSDRGISGDLACERIALLYSSDPRKRRIAFSAATVLRKRRNDATHRGENQVNDEDRHLLMVCKRLSYSIMQEFVFLAQSHQWAEQKDVTEYFDDLRFGKIENAPKAAAH